MKKNKKKVKQRLGAVVKGNIPEKVTAEDIPASAFSGKGNGTYGAHTKR